jgi:hypothetical protein
MIKQARSGAFAAFRTHALRLAALLALGGLLAACDRCGDFWSPWPGQACHSDAKPR